MTIALHFSIRLAVSFLFIFVTASLFGQEKNKTNNLSLSPYFFVKGDDHTVESFPLLSTDVQVDIAGVVADVRVKQVYKNDGLQPIEAVYTFPASTRAAVYGMKMTIGKRVLEAEIQERQQARQSYEKAKEEGKQASLFEQQRPNVFQMNVANIMPGEQIVVELSFTELLVPDEGVYEFVYPTVVGPRYSNQQAAQATDTEQFVETPYLEEGKKSPSKLTLQARINAGMPVTNAFSKSHKVMVNYVGNDKVNVLLDESELRGGSRDFILQYELKGKAIESGMLLYEGKKENYFLMMMQPPKRVDAADISPREYIFIVDVSGSMNGFPLDVSKKLMRDLISQLRPVDKFNVLLFAASNEVFAEESLSATENNLQKAINWITQQRGYGGTELLAAMNRALSLPKADCLVIWLLKVAPSTLDA